MTCLLLTASCSNRVSLLPDCPEPVTSGYNGLHQVTSGYNGLQFVCDKPLIPVPENLVIEIAAGKMSRIDAAGEDFIRQYVARRKAENAECKKNPVSGREGR